MSKCDLCKSLFWLRVPEGESTVAGEREKHGSRKLGQEAERSHPQPQTQNTESELKLGQDYELSEPTPK